MVRLLPCNNCANNAAIGIPKGAFAATLLLALAALVMSAALVQAQTFHLLHTFTGGSDSAYPYATVTLDRAGNLYGTTYGLGRTYGSVYELERHGSSWIFKPLYNFQATNDGNGPQAPVVFGPDGALYGTTSYGGNSCFTNPCGTVFSLRPPSRFCGNVNCPWIERPVYWFGGTQIQDGYRPWTGPLVFDSAGNIYGTTSNGGPMSNGTVYQLFRTQNGWGETILDSLPGHDGPGHPQAGVSLDATGNLYGTAQGGFGVVYAVLHTDQGWMQQTIHIFQGGNDGAYPSGGVIFDAAGNAYGTTAGGSGQRGTVFQLTPQIDGTWTETVLHEFSAGSIGPKSNLAMDAAGNLYGTTQGLGGIGNDQFGMVFKLSLVNGSWVFTDLHDFTGGDDGDGPVGGVTVDAAGNLYGTAAVGGAHNYGTVWEITP